MHGDPEAARDREFGGHGPAEGAAGPAAGGRGRYAAGGGDAGRFPDHPPRSRVRAADGGGARGDAPPAGCAARTGEVTSPVWLSLDVVLAVHDEQLAEHGG